MPSDARAGAIAVFAWLGAVFFLVSLLFCGFSFIVTMGRSAVGASAAAAIAIDVALFSAFALHHSVFARGAVRRAVQRLAGNGERSAYVWIASALLIAVCSAW